VDVAVVLADGLEDAGVGGAGDLAADLGGEQFAVRRLLYCLQRSAAALSAVRYAADTACDTFAARR
jgi:hypothetical protein